MSALETPRTWTLVGNRKRSVCASYVLFDAQLTEGEHVEVVERTPVDAERERMPDLIEALRNEIVSATAMRWKPEWEAAKRADALLREHNRLGVPDGD